MAEWTKNPAETYPLRERNTENVSEEKGDSTMSPVMNSPQPAGFVYPTATQKSTDNPYATQPAYDSSYKLVEDTIVPQINDEHINEPQNYCDIKDDTETQKDSCLTYCIMVSLIAVAIAIIGWVIYLITKNPKIGRVLHNIAKEARKQHDTQEEETPLFRKMFNPVIHNGMTKLMNDTSKS